MSEGTNQVVNSGIKILRHSNVRLNHEKLSSYNKLIKFYEVFVWLKEKISIADYESRKTMADSVSD